LLLSAVILVVLLALHFDLGLQSPVIKTAVCYNLSLETLCAKLLQWSKSRSCHREVSGILSFIDGIEH
jgi:hypothetical protein